MKHERLTPAIKKQFTDLACSLSPENLTCDGELSQSQVKDRQKALMVKWWALEDKIGMKVTEDMVWGWAAKEVTHD